MESGACAFRGLDCGRWGGDFVVVVVWWVEQTDARFKGDALVVRYGRGEKECIWCAGERCILRSRAL